MTSHCDSEIAMWDCYTFKLFRKGTLNPFYALQFCTTYVNNHTLLSHLLGEMASGCHVGQQEYFLPSV